MIFYVKWNEYESYWLSQMRFLMFISPFICMPVQFLGLCIYKFIIFNCDTTETTKKKVENVLEIRDGS